MTDARTAIEGIWRAEAGSIRGVLARRLGDLDRAEEALQEAVGEALKRWSVEGVPQRPAGWLVTTAWRKALDRLRHEKTGRGKLLALAATAPAEPTGDDRLALIFACCHPALPEHAQVALTLHAVCDMSAEQIGAAFLVRTATMAQRLVRAKRQLRECRGGFELPSPEEYGDRLRAVLAVVYLVFNEGYLATSGDAPQRRELAREALDLARQLDTLMPTEPEVAGLTALIELNEARAAARFDAHGRLLLLEEQDRRSWDVALIEVAVARLARVAAHDRPGPYQVQAAIAAQHALAPSWQHTNWAAVRRLYDRLHEMQPSPLVRLGRAVATGFVNGLEAALAEVDALSGRLDDYRLWHATRADLLRRLGRTAEAVEATRRALALATNPAERELLRRRLDGLRSAG
ncbi:MAG TPA: DUF6596 domain-containing protein [Micromonosporaceae bacterium]|nr:DUF6596 domain-containing protein [Micromonosporaceae bacterium]